MNLERTGAQTGIDDRPLVCPGRLMSMSAIGTKRTTLPDYVAIGGLFALAVWAAADLIPHDKFKLYGARLSRQWRTAERKHSH